MTERFSISAPAKLAAALRKCAKANGRTLAAEVVAVLLEALRVDSEVPKHGGSREGAGRPKS